VNQPSDKKQSNSGSVEATVRAYDRELHGFLMRRLGGRKELSEDIRQEIYLRIWRFSDTELVREPRAYLFRVARNVLHDKLLLAERERATFGNANDGIVEGITDDHASHTDNERDLQRILSKLPKLYRAILLLRTAQGMSYSEIAKELQLSEHTVKKYMHLALVNARLISLELK
jgi:RNA polymerase sigma-70 factor (ECF subfamily)